MQTNNFISQRALAITLSSLDVTVLKITVQYNQANGYDTHGCPKADQAQQDKYYAKFQYSITNNGEENFSPPSGFVGWAACYTPAIINFLHLNIQGAKDSSGNAVPINVDRFATCVVDDSDTSCSQNTNPSDHLAGPLQPLIISKGGSYGVSKTVYVKFPLTADQYNALSNSASTSLTFTLSVNSDISPGTPGVVSAINGASQLSGITWKTGATYHDPIDLYTAPPSTAYPTTRPTVDPTTGPTAIPTTRPTVVPTTEPSEEPIPEPAASPFT